MGVLDATAERLILGKTRGNSWIVLYNDSGSKCNLLGNFLLRASQRRSGFESLHNILKIYRPLFVYSTKCVKSKPGSSNSMQL